MNSRKWKRAMGIAARCALLGSLVMNAAVAASAKTKLDPCSFQQDMRKLWEDHVTWTRIVIIGVLADLPDQSAATQRLLQNQSDIGNAVKPFYGDAAGNQLTLLLRDHILIAAEILQAARQGNNPAVQDALDRWYTNGDDIAGFLSAANPQLWPLMEMRSMMKEHLDWTLSEALARLKKDWEGDVAAYDHIHVQALAMADMLSMGIAGQFPTLFQHSHDDH